MAHLFVNEGVDVDALVARLQRMCTQARLRRGAAEEPLDVALAQQGWSVATSPAHAVIRADLVNFDSLRGLTWTRAHIDQRDFSSALARPLTVVPSAITSALDHTTSKVAFSQLAPGAPSTLVAFAVAAVMALMPVSAQERWRRCAVPLPFGLLIGHIDQREGWRLTRFSPAGTVPAWRRFETLMQVVSEEGARWAFAGHVDIGQMTTALSLKIDALRVSRTIASRCQQLGTRPVHVPGRRHVA
ncbi:hypothetical protein [Paraburkholderia youngii]|uniref:hypothetical protein n=1 Tax=Paraburkholderia youngii TaxID=2782701 RepID=UPI003D19E1CC